MVVIYIDQVTKGLAMRARLSTVGSVFGTICVNEVCNYVVEDT